MKQFLIKALVVTSMILAIVVVLDVVGIPHSKPALGDVANPNSFSRATSTQAIAGTADIVVLATRSERTYALITNDSDTTVYLGLNGGLASKSAGIRLNANGGSYEITPDNLYFGAIHAITTASNKKLTVIEK